METWQAPRLGSGGAAVRFDLPKVQRGVTSVGGGGSSRLWQPRSWERPPPAAPQRSGALYDQAERLRQALLGNALNVPSQTCSGGRSRDTARVGGDIIKEVFLDVLILKGFQEYDCIIIYPHK